MPWVITVAVIVLYVAAWVYFSRHNWLLWLCVGKKKPRDDIPGGKSLKYPATLAVRLTDVTPEPNMPIGHVVQVTTIKNRSEESTGATGMGPVIVPPPADDEFQNTLPAAFLGQEQRRLRQAEERRLREAEERHTHEELLKKAVQEGLAATTFKDPKIIRVDELEPEPPKVKNRYDMLRGRS